MGKYDNNTPMEDSSPGSEDYRDTIGANSIDETAVVLVWSDGDSMFCKCGCLTPRTPGSKSEFKQGHDARLKGILQRAHVRGSEVTIVDGGAMSSQDAMTLATTRGWERFLVKAENTAEARARKATTRKPGRAAGKVANADLLGSMKAALSVLKEIGRDTGERKIEVTRDNYQSILDGTHPDLKVHVSGFHEGQIVKVNRRGKRDATIAEITGDRARIVYKTDAGKETDAVVEIASLQAWAEEK